MMESDSSGVVQESVQPTQGVPQMQGTMSLNDASLNPPADNAGSQASSFNIENIVNADGTFKEGWTSNYDGAEGLGKYNNINDLVNGFVNANKLIGRKSEPMRRPGAEATAEQRKAWREYMGVPESAEAYEAPEEYNDDKHAEAFKEFAKFAYEHDIPNDIAKELIRYEEKYLAQRHEEFNRKVEEGAREARKYFHDEWGGQYDRNIAMLKDGLQRAGIDIDAPEMAAALNNTFILSALHEKIAGMQDGAIPVQSFTSTNTSDAKTQIIKMIREYGSADRMPPDVRASYHRLISNGNIRW